MTKGRPSHGITGRIVATLAMAANGLTSEESAQKAGVTLCTVKRQRRDAIRKLRAENMPHAVALAFRAGLLR